MRREHALLLGLLILAGALRFATIGRASLWFDEANMYHLTRGTLGETLAANATRNSAPPLFALALNLVTRVNDRELGMRFLPALGGAFAPLVMCAAARLWFGVGPSLLAGLLMALSASQVAYAHHSREYALVPLVSAGMIWSVGRFCQRPAAGTAAAMAGLLTVGVFLQYGLSLLVAGLQGAFLWAVITQRSHRKPLLIGWAGVHLLLVGAVAVVWQTALRVQFRSGRGSEYLAEHYGPTSEAGPLGFLGSNLADLVRFAYPSYGLIFVIVLGGVAALVASLWRGETEPDYAPAGLLAAMVVGPLAVFAGAGLVGVYPFGGVRQCMALLPVVSLLAAAGTDGMARLSPRPAIACVAIGAVLAVPGLVTSIRQLRQPPAEDMRQLLSLYRQNARPGDRFIVLDGARPAFRYYIRNSRAIPSVTLYAKRDFETLYAQVEEAYTRYPRSAFWIVASHISVEDADRIAANLPPGRSVQKIYSGVNAALYVAPK